MRAVLREGLDPISLERRLWGGKGPPHQADAKDQRVEEVDTRSRGSFDGHEIC